MDKPSSSIAPGGSARGGDIKFLSRLGTGGFGEVLLAETPEGLKAVKVVDTAAWSTEEYEVFNAMLMAEASFLSTLRHPILPQFHSLVAEGSCYYLLMEWVKGQNLEEFVHQQGALKLEDLHSLLGALLKVLHYFHREVEGGVVFGDLKPANVLRSSDGEYRLVDLGLASKVGHRMGGRFAIFSPSFSAPERIVGAQSHPAQDLYSLGATLLFAMGGVESKRGWSPGAAQDVMTRWLSAVQGDWGEASLHCFKKLMTLLLACLDPEPAGRPAHVQILCQSWARVEEIRVEESRAVEGPNSADEIMRLLYKRKRG